MGPAAICIIPAFPRSNYKLELVSTFILGLRFICSHAQKTVFLLLLLLLAVEAYLLLISYIQFSFSVQIPPVLTGASSRFLLTVRLLQKLQIQFSGRDGEIHGNGGCRYKDRRQV